MDATPTSLYRYYDKHDVLVYVGITNRGVGRNHEHSRRAEWWPYVVRQEVEHFPDRARALHAESTLIQKHMPPFNTQHNGRHEEQKALYQRLVGDPEASFQTVYQLHHHKLRFWTADYEAKWAPRLNLVTDPMMHLIARSIQHRANRLVIWDGKAIGAVRGVLHDGYHTYLDIQLRRGWSGGPPTWGVANLRVISLKDPPSTFIRTVFIGNASMDLPEHVATQMASYPTAHGCMPS